MEEDDVIVKWLKNKIEILTQNNLNFSLNDLRKMKVSSEEIGMDSLNIYDLAAAIEMGYDIFISDDDLKTLNTIADYENLIKNKRKIV